MPGAMPKRGSSSSRRILYSWSVPTPSTGADCPATIAILGLGILKAPDSERLCLKSAWKHTCLLAHGLADAGQSCPDQQELLYLLRLFGSFAWNGDCWEPRPFSLPMNFPRFFYLQRDEVVL